MPTPFVQLRFRPAGSLATPTGAHFDPMVASVVRPSGKYDSASVLAARSIASPSSAKAMPGPSPNALWIACDGP